MALDIIIILVLVIIGLILIMSEIFLFPGITIAGIGGSAILIGVFIYSFYYMGNVAGGITVFGTCALGLGAFFFLIKSKTLDRFALKTDIDSKIDQTDQLKIRVGDRGVTLSRINPMGKAEFENNIIIEVKSFSGEFIDSQVEIEVVKTDGSSTLIQPIHLA